MASAVAGNESFDPLLVGYWKGHVLPRAVPNIVLLALALAVVLALLLWCALAAGEGE